MASKVFPCEVCHRNVEQLYDSVYPGKVMRRHLRP